jgi:uncharacterized protein (DUF2147 family)
MRVLLIAFCACLTVSVSSQSVLGKWKTIHESGDSKSIVDIYHKGDKLYGRVVKLFRSPDEDQNPLCDECQGEFKDQPVIGMEILRDMELDGDEWEDGTILDPNNGEIYDCKLWLDEDDADVLQVRGYVWMFYRTQAWERVK